MIRVNVSIHAPTWGATDNIIITVKTLEFQSTHPHGVRRKLLSDIELFGGFNPRTHMGCDLISEGRIIFKHSFNPRTHMGCDFPTVICSPRKSVFQSTHPHGVRRHRGVSPLQIYAVSIHAPTWGATAYSAKG